jgi:hypothetical protein
MHFRSSHRLLWQYALFSFYEVADLCKGCSLRVEQWGFASTLIVSEYVLQVRRWVGYEQHVGYYRHEGEVVRIFLVLVLSNVFEFDCHAEVGNRSQEEQVIGRLLVFVGSVVVL